jgi:hypothetical protein
MCGNFRHPKYILLEMFQGGKITACHKYQLIISFHICIQTKGIKRKRACEWNTTYKLLLNCWNTWSLFSFISSFFITVNYLSFSMYEEWGLPVTWIVSYMRKTHNRMWFSPFPVFHFWVINSNPTQQYNKTIKQTLKQCNNIIQKETIWRYANINPAPPNLHTTIKLHKPNTTISPISNWKNTPTYELAKYKIFVSSINNLVKRLNTVHKKYYNIN